MNPLPEPVIAFYYDLRAWLICKLAGRSPVMLNVQVTGIAGGTAFGAANLGKENKWVCGNNTFSIAEDNHAKPIQFPWSNSNCCLTP